MGVRNPLWVVPAGSIRLWKRPQSAYLTKPTRFNRLVLFMDNADQATRVTLAAKAFDSMKTINIDGSAFGVLEIRLGGGVAIFNQPLSQFLTIFPGQAP